MQKLSIAAVRRKFENATSYRLVSREAHDGKPLPPADTSRRYIERVTGTGVYIPDYPYAMTRFDGGGTWELADDGKIRYTLPEAPNTVGLTLIYELWAPGV